MNGHDFSGSGSGRVGVSGSSGNGSGGRGGSGAGSTAGSVSGSGGHVVFAEPPEWAAHAVVTYDGQVLTPVSGSGTPTYVLPSSGGRLEADLPPSHQRWFLAQLLLLAAVVFLAIPFGTRRSRRLT